MWKPVVSTDGMAQTDYIFIIFLFLPASIFFVCVPRVQAKTIIFLFQPHIEKQITLKSITVVRFPDWILPRYRLVTHLVEEGQGAKYIFRRLM